MKTATKRSLATILLSAFLLSACGDNNNVVPPAPPAPISRLYMASTDSNSVLAYDTAATVTGDVAASRTIAGALTTLDSSNYSLAYDSRTNTLIAGLSASVLFFDNVVTTTGNVAPSRTLAGGVTGLLPVTYVAVDEARNLLYAASRDSASVSVFINANTVTGNVAPARVITGALTLLGTTEKRMFLDSTNDRLYVANFGGGVLVFNNASTAVGNVAPNRVISGASTTFVGIWGIEVDVSRNLLYVSDFDGNAINIFANADTATGNIAPTRRIVGALTTLSSPADLYVDTNSDTIYQAGGSGNSMLVWNNASTATGNVAPNRAVVGAATGISYATGIVGAR